MDPETWNSFTAAEKEAFFDGPALEPPPGLESNFDNPTNHNSLVLGVTIACLVLATSSGIIRIYSGVFVKKAVHVEDGLALIAFGAYAGCLWVIFRALSLGGIFIHQWDIRARVFQDVIYAIYFLRVFYAFTMLFAKTAILIEWMRIFVPRGTRNFFFWVCLPVLILNATFYIVAIFIISFTCRPVEKWWKPMVPGVCISRRSFDFSSGCINLALDIIILLLPQRTIWKLNMSLKRKVGISLIFSIGVLACASALGRVITGIPLIWTTDRTYNTGPPMMCLLAEMTCALLVFCVPSAPKAFAQVTWTAWATEFAAILRSWTRIGTRNQSADSARATWVDVNQSREYECLEEGDQIQLKIAANRAGLGVAPSPLENGNQGIYAISGGGILHTTTLTARHDAVSMDSFNEQASKQHPWMTRRN